jgi:phosphoribosylanthranilate isomerase
MSEASNQIGLTVAQIYPDSQGHLAKIDDDFYREAQCNVIVALPFEVFKGGESGEPNAFFLSAATLRRILGVLIDSGSFERPGGTGEKFDWEHAQFVREGMKRIGASLILAGGLTSGNVMDAMDAFKPWGVDVVSGVEASPGKKDPEKVRAFVRAVREFDRRVG